MARFNEKTVFILESEITTTTGSRKGRRPLWKSYQTRQLLDAVVSHDADAVVGAPELIDHSPGNLDCAVNDVALPYREHAVDWQEPVGVGAYPVR